MEGAVYITLMIVCAIAFVNMEQMSENKTIDRKYSVENIINKGVLMGNERKPLILAREQEPLLGVEKIVYKILDISGTIAAKIFREDVSSDGSKFAQSRESRVQGEAYAYQKLKDTPLGIYIPEYLDVLYDNNGSTIGIAIKWEDGVSIKKMEGNLLPKDEFDRFETALLTTINSGVIPSSETFSYQNVIYNYKRFPALWIAECGIEDKPFDRQLYNETIAEIRSIIKP